MANRLYIGVGGHVVALDSATGTELWRTKLKTSTLTTVWFDGGRVYGGAQGELFCLDPATGHIQWRNRLKGLGLGVVAFPGSPQEAVAAAQASARRAAAAG